MQDKKVRWAILGAGKIAEKFVHDFKAVENAELVAVSARDINRAKEFAERYNIPNGCDYDELYKSENVDAVYIATTHNFHFEQTLRCLEHRKGVLCEKPITINDAEFNKLAAVANEKGVFLMEALWTYFLPALQKAKEWIAEGKIGAIKMIQADFGYQMEFNPEGRMYNLALAGGALLDLGIYPIAFSTFFMNRMPDDINASAVVGKTKVDESTAMILQYGEAVSVLHCSVLTHTPITGYVFGDKGFVEIPHFFDAVKANLYNTNHDLVDSFVDKRVTLGYNFEIKEATDCILQGKLQSEVVSHAVSNTLQEIMTTVRRKIGVHYPNENEEVYRKLFTRSL
jgi:predicted dehydrogenase